MGGTYLSFWLDGTINQAIDSVVRLIYCDPLKGVSKANSFTIGKPSAKLEINVVFMNAKCTYASHYTLWTACANCCGQFSALKVD